jgi:hypothetical protein
VIVTTNNEKSGISGIQEKIILHEEVILKLVNIIN